MLTLNKFGAAINQPTHELYCLSTDTKPTDVPNGSVLYEIDSGVIYVFDEENKEWYEAVSFGGGGGTAFVTTNTGTAGQILSINADGTMTWVDRISQEEVLEALEPLGIVALADENGNVLTDEEGNVLVTFAEADATEAT